MKEEDVAPEERHFYSYLANLRNSIDYDHGISGISGLSPDRLLKQLPLPSMIIDLKDGSIIDLNEKLLEDTGLSRDDAIGKTAINLGLWESLESIKRPLEGSDESEIRTRLNVKTRSGDIISYWLSSEVFKLEGRKCLICFLYPDNMADGQADLSALLKSVSESSNHGICLIRQNRYIYANRVFADITGLPLEQIYKLSPDETITKIVHPDFLHIVQSTYSEFKSGSSPTGNLELKILHPDYGERWLDLDARVIAMPENPVILAVFVDITERKNIYEKLKTNERLFLTIMDSTTDSIFLKNEKLEYTFVNSQMGKLFNRECSELLGKTDEELFDAEAAAHIRGVDERVLRGEIVKEEHAKAVNGVEHIFHVVKTPIRDNHGDITGLCGIARDITDRKNAEREIEKAGQRFKTIIENTNDLICSYTPDGTITYASPQTIRYGYQPEDVIGHKIFEFIHPDDLEKVVSDLQKTIHTGEEFPTGFRLQASNGEYFFVEEQSSVLRHDDKIVQLSGVIRDLTERKSAEDALRDSEVKYRNLVETMSEGIGAIDAEGKITFVNNSACRMLDYSQDELLGRKLSDILDQSSMEIMKEQISIRRQGRRSSYELCLTAKTGREVQVRLSSVPIYDKHANYIGSFGIMTDITEQKVIENRLKQAHFEMNQIFQAAAPMMVIGMDHRISKVNIPFLEMRKTSQEELIGEKCHDIFTCADCGTDRCPINRIIRGERQFQYESEIDIKADSNIHALITAKPYQDVSGQITGIVLSFTDISERVRMEATLKESEERFRELAELAPEFIYEMNNDGILTFANRVAFEKTGYTAEDLKKGIKAINFIIPEHRERALQNIKKLYTLEDIGSNDYEVVRKDGSTFFVTMHSAPIIRNGEIVGIRGVIVDITDRKRSDEALRKSELFNRAVVEKSPLGISVRSKTGKLLSCNESWRKIWGRSEAEIQEYLDQPERQSLCFDSRDEYLEPWHEKLMEVYTRGGYLHIPEAQLRYHKKGGERWISQHFYAIKDSGGSVDRVVILTEDITERKRAVESLKQSEAYYRGLYESDHDALIIIDPEHEVILDVNRRAMDIYGYERAELIGKSISELTMDLEKCRKHLGSVFKAESYYSFETIQRRKDGTEMILEVNAAVIEYKGRQAILSVNQDITEKRRAEIALRENEEKYRLLVENAGLPIFSVNYDGKFMTMNSTAAEYLGGKPKDFLGKKMQDLFSSDIAERQLTSIRRALQTGKKVVRENPTDFRGEERWFLTSIQPIQESGNTNTSALLIANDITQRKKLELRERAKVRFLDGLRKEKSINRCLELCCLAINEAKLYGKIILAIYDENLAFNNFGQSGFESTKTISALKYLEPEEILMQNLTLKKSKSGHSMYIMDGIKLKETIEKPTGQSQEKSSDFDEIIGGDIIYMPLLDEKNEPEGWLLAAKPLLNRKPDLDEIAFIEELVDIAVRHVKGMRYLQLLEDERQALQKSNITLREVLTLIEEEKMEIRNSIAKEVQSSIMPLVKKLVRPDGKINKTCYNVLAQGLDSLVTPSGTQQIYAKLSPREIEICNLIKMGSNSKAIGKKLRISLATVQKHRESIRRKLNITNKEVNLMTYLRG